MMATVLGGGGVSVTYSISGVVYDADGTTPVAGATITLGALSAISAANGTYTVSGVAVGASGSMTCTLTGYSWTTITISAMSANLTAQNYTNAWWAAGGSAAKISAVYKPKGAANLAASYLRIAGSGGNANLDPAVVGVGVAPTWNATNGWIFNGTTQFLSTGIVPANNQGWGMVIKWSNPHATSIFVALAGVSHAAGEGFMTPLRRDLTPDSYNYYNGGLLLLTGVRTAESGCSAVSGNKGYFNGAAETGTIPTSVTPNTLDIYIGTAHVAAGAYFAARQDCYIQAIAIYSTAPTAAQILAISAAIDP
jgi:hypothetical protein